MAREEQSRTAYLPTEALSSQPNLSFGTFRFNICIKSLMVLPPYKGGVFKGAFGYAFRRVVCAVPKGECEPCILRRKCLYANLFEPPAPKDFEDCRKYRRPPPPYVLRPPITNRQAFHPGETLEFELVLLGPALEALPYFIYTITEMGRWGLGRERGTFDLITGLWLDGEASVEVYDGYTQTLKNVDLEDRPVRPEPENVSKIILEFITPFRTKEKGRLVTQLKFPLFFERLFQRIELLTALYGNGKTEDLPDLKSRAEEIKVAQDDLYWYDWGRYSSRQKESMRLGGLRGEITFKGDLDPFTPHLRIGEKVHAGQGASFGLGWYRTMYT